jgi:hypothetical protein
MDKKTVETRTNGPYTDLRDLLERVEGVGE